MQDDKQNEMHIDNNTDANIVALDTDANIVALEAELKRLQNENKQLHAQTEEYESEIQVVRDEFNEEVKRKVQESMHPQDFIAVEEAEVQIALDLDVQIGKMFDAATSFAELQSSKLGMLSSSDLLPNKTSSDGCDSIQVNIQSQTKKLQQAWERIAGDIKKQRNKYGPIQKLRHHSIKYRTKHKVSVKRDAAKKAAHQKLKASQYLDLKASEYEAAEVEVEAEEADSEFDGR